MYRGRANNIIAISTATNYIIISILISLPTINIEASEPSPPVDENSDALDSMCVTPRVHAVRIYKLRHCVCPTHVQV